MCDHNLLPFFLHMQEFTETGNVKGRFYSRHARCNSFTCSMSRGNAPFLYTQRVKKILSVVVVVSRDSLKREWSAWKTVRSTAFSARKWPESQDFSRLVDPFFSTIRPVLYMESDFSVIEAVIRRNVRLRGPKDFSAISMRKCHSWTPESTQSSPRSRVTSQLSHWHKTRNTLNVEALEFMGFYCSCFVWISIVKLKKCVAFYSPYYVNAFFVLIWVFCHAMSQ